MWGHQRKRPVPALTLFLKEERDRRQGFPKPSPEDRSTGPGLETIADPAARAATKELVQLLMDMHGAGLERVMEIVFQSGEPGVRID